MGHNSCSCSCCWYFRCILMPLQLAWASAEGPRALPNGPRRGGPRGPGLPHPPPRPASDIQMGRSQSINSPSLASMHLPCTFHAPSMHPTPWHASAPAGCASLTASAGCVGLPSGSAKCRVCQVPGLPSGSAQCRVCPVPPSCIPSCHGCGGG